MSLTPSTKYSTCVPIPTSPYCTCFNRQSYPCRVSEKRSDQSADTSASVAASADGKGSVVFDFDQVDRHRKFWEYLRNKEWTAVATFLEKKVSLLIVLLCDAGSCDFVC
jgi:hypothetical protein